MAVNFLDCGYFVIRLHGIALQLRLNKDGHIIGTEYLSDLVEKEHTVHKHGESLFVFLVLN